MKFFRPVSLLFHEPSMLAITNSPVEIVYGDANADGLGISLMSTTMALGANSRYQPVSLTLCI